MRLAWMSDGVDLAGRLLLAGLFLDDGWTVLQNYDGTVAYLAQHGVPPLLLPLALVTQIGGGLLVILGWWTRLAAFALAGFCVSTAVIFHAFSPDFGDHIHFWKDLAIAGGFLVLLANGPRKFSLDAHVARGTIATGDMRKERLN